MILVFRSPPAAPRSMLTDQRPGVLSTLRSKSSMEPYQVTEPVIKSLDQVSLGDVQDMLEYSGLLHDRSISYEGKIHDPGDT